MCEARVQPVWEFKQATLESQSCLPECTLACALARTLDLRGLVNCARFNFLCFFYGVFLQASLPWCIAPQVSCASLLRSGKIKLLKVNLSIPPCLQEASRSPNKGINKFSWVSAAAELSSGFGFFCCPVLLSAPPVGPQSGPQTSWDLKGPGPLRSATDGCACSASITPRFAPGSCVLCLAVVQQSSWWLYSGQPECSHLLLRPRPRSITAPVIPSPSRKVWGFVRCSAAITTR